MNESIIDRNASPSANGWFFQISAGMFLFLRDIQDNKSLKIEGKSEDIEIETEYGLVYAQAKSIYDVNVRSSVYSDYMKALESLKDNGDRATKLIYISNIEDPFNDRKPQYYKYDTEFSFSQLDLKTQNKISRVLGEDFDYGKLIVIIKHFYGEPNNKRRLLLDEISKFLIHVVSDDKYKNEIYDSLITEGLKNASDKRYDIKKNQFAFKLILPYLEKEGPSEEAIAIDFDNYENANEIYNLFLRSLEADYSLFSLILSDYKNEKTRTNCTMPDFVRSSADKYLYMIPENYDEEIRRELVRILTFRVLRRHSYIEKIKKAANI